jgi:hypothetical protein
VSQAVHFSENEWEPRCYTAIRVLAIRRPDPSVVNPLQPSASYKERRTSLISFMIIWALLLVLVLALMVMPIVVWFLAAGE